MPEAHEVDGDDERHFGGFAEEDLSDHGRQREEDRVEYRLERGPSFYQRHKVLCKVAGAAVAVVIGLSLIGHADNNGSLGPPSSPPAVTQPVGPTWPAPPPANAPAHAPQVQVDVVPHYSAAQPGLPATVTLDLKFTNLDSAEASAPAFAIQTPSGRAYMSGTLNSTPGPDAKSASFPALSGNGGSFTDNVTIPANQVPGEFWVVVKANGGLDSTTPTAHLSCLRVSGPSGTECAVVH